MLGRAAAEGLESGRWGGALGRLAERGWARVADPVRPVRLPSGARIIGIGGATLGGSGKTPLVLELARALGERGRGRPGTLAVVAHGYGGRPGPARVVEASDRACEVGDEALLLSRALRSLGVPTVVARSREQALAVAGTLGAVLLVDGLLQARPEPLDLGILVLDSRLPWGAGRCPPAGDLRASRSRLLAAADMVVLNHDPVQGPSQVPGELARFRGAIWVIESDVVGARCALGQRLTLTELASRRVGLLLGVARPERVLRALQARGVVPARVEVFRDHGKPPRAAADRAGWRTRPRLDGWLTTSKCATKLGPSYGGVPVWVVDHEIRLPSELVSLCVRN